MSDLHHRFSSHIKFVDTTLEPNLDFSHHAYELGKWIFVISLLQLLLCIPTPSKLKLHQRLYIAAIYLWLPLLPVLLYSAGTAVLTLQSDIDNRWYGTTTGSYIFLRLYNALNIVGILVEFFSWWSEGGGWKELKGRSASIGHHIFSVCAYVVVLLFFNNQMHYFACLDGLCEITTIHLTMLQLSKLKDKYKLDAFPFSNFLQEKCQLLLTLNGFLLWLTYIVFRLILFPYWLWIFYNDITSMSGLIWNNLTWFEITFYPSVNVFLLIVSSIWFNRIHQGLMKVVRAGGDTRVVVETGTTDYNDESKKE